MFARYLREEKGLEAYVYHGPTVSSVCLGAFSTDAIEMPERAPDIRIGLGVSTPQGTVSDVELAEQTKVIDPKARALKDEMPYMFHNGRIRTKWIYRPQTSTMWQGRKVKMPSVFVRIPAAEGSAAEGLIP